MKVKIEIELDTDKKKDKDEILDLVEMLVSTLNEQRSEENSSTEQSLQIVGINDAGTRSSEGPMDAAAAAE